MKVISGPDHNGAFAAIELAKKDNFVDGEALCQAVIDLNISLVKGSYTGNEEDWDSSWKEICLEDAEIQASMFRGLLEKINPDIIVACHGSNVGNAWLVTLEDEKGKYMYPLDFLLEDIAFDNPGARVWIISCNPEGIVPTIPEGLKVWWRIGSSNPFLDVKFSEWIVQG